MGVWEERRYKQDPREGDFRTEYQRDHARLVHSYAFRRLQSKTQVLGLGESDFYRTRLTHSMEVAQIGTGINFFLLNKYKNDQEIRDAIASRSLMNAICLAHDIGHPPFGHGGEVALNYCMHGHGGFEGNGQTLRILSKLDKYTEDHGVNPTRRMLLGILKYPAPYSRTVNQSKYTHPEPDKPNWFFQSAHWKPPKCYFDDDQDVVDWILGPLSTEDLDKFSEVEGKGSKKHKKTANRSLDTSIMEIADDISYSIHDLEDAIAIKMIRYRDWKEHCDPTLFQRLGLDLEKVGKELFLKKGHHRKAQIGSLVHQMISNVEIRFSRIPDSEFGSIRFNAYLKESFRALLEHIHDLVDKKVIFSDSVQQLEFKGQKLVTELFEVLAHDPLRLLPEATKQRYQISELEGLGMRVICDYVSGMTDEYATRTYEKIFLPRRGSIFERL